MLKDLRANPTLAHVLRPAGGVHGDAFGAGVVQWIENSELPWHVQMPELWVYPLQTLLCAALLLFFRQHYTLAPWRGLGLASLLAVLGIGCWIAPEMLRRVLIERGHEAKDWWDWLGLAGAHGRL